MNPPNPPHLSDDVLIDLVQGLLSPQEAAVANRHLEGCPECEERARVHLRDRESLRAAGTPRKQDGQFVAGGAPPPRMHRAHARTSLYVMAVASLVIVAAVAFWPRPDTAYWFPTQFVESVSRGGSNGYANALKQARGLYEARDAEGTLDALHGIDLSEASLSVRTTTALYRASALVNLGRCGEAIDALRQIDAAFAGDAFIEELKALPLPWREEALWILFLASDQNGDEAMTCEALRGLSEEEGEKAVRAREELSGRDC